jgi:hypothetical protein
MNIFTKPKEVKTAYNAAKKKWGGGVFPMK